MTYLGATHVSVLRPKPKLLPPLGEEDEDVAVERERVTRGTTQGDLLVLRDLTKVHVTGRVWEGVSLAHFHLSGI